MKQLQKYIIVLAIFAEVIVFSMLSPQFLSVDNLINVALSIAITGILAVGMTFVILTGGIDLSIGSVLAVAGIVAAICAKSFGDGGVFIGIIAAVAIGVISGLFNGITISRFKVPPFVVTLAVLTIARGLSFIIADKFAGSTSVSDLPSGFAFLGREKIFGLPVPVITMLIMFAIGWFILTQTRFGRYVYAIGGNSEASFLAGINVKSVTTWVYVLNGFLVGLAACHACITLRCRTCQRRNAIRIRRDCGGRSWRNFADGWQRERHFNPFRCNIYRRFEQRIKSRGN